jgi:hypothetical protein
VNRFRGFLIPRPHWRKVLYLFGTLKLHLLLTKTLKFLKNFKISIFSKNLYFWESRLQHEWTWWLQVLWKFWIFWKFLKFLNCENLEILNFKKKKYFRILKFLWKFRNFWNFWKLVVTMYIHVEVYFLKSIKLLWMTGEIAYQCPWDNIRI